VEFNKFLKFYVILGEKNFFHEVVQAWISSNIKNIINNQYNDHYIDVYQRCPWRRGGGRIFWIRLQKCMDFYAISMLTSTILYYLMNPVK